MRITIDIGDTPTQGGPVAELSIPGTAEPSTASADLLARAEAVGAIDGGGAPTSLPQAGAPPIPPVVAGEETPTSAAAGPPGSAMPAGPAPGMPAPPSVIVEQDPDAPTTPAEED